MGLATVYARAAVGLGAPLVTVEVNLSPGLPRFSIVGLPETTVRESRDRVKAALVNSGFDFPQRAITAHLAPADLPKHGGRYDLAIGLGILEASGQLKPGALVGHEFVGELGLSGDLRRVSAVLPAALAARDADRRLVVPAANEAEVALLSGVRACAATRLIDVAAHFADAPLSPIEHAMPARIRPGDRADLTHVGGQRTARRALEIAAAGGHNLLLIGPPGSGKTLLARCLPGLLPPLDEAEALERAVIESLGGRTVETPAFWEPPFRAPHHTASAAALVGGGTEPKPGEVSRAHRGVLFLDELAEFPRHVLEVLREPLEAGHVTISRASGQTDFPSEFLLIAAMNPCPCGYSGDDSVACRCTPDQIARYQGRLSGPLLDRIDLSVAMRRVSYTDLRGERGGAESSATVAGRVRFARRRQIARQKTLNSAIAQALRQPSCRIDAAGDRLLEQAMQRYSLSARVIERTLKVARTIADLDGSSSIESAHLAEALSLRQTLGTAGTDRRQVTSSLSR